MPHWIKYLVHWAALPGWFKVKFGDFKSKLFGKKNVYGEIKTLGSHKWKISLATLKVEKNQHDKKDDCATYQSSSRNIRRDCNPVLQTRCMCLKLQFPLLGLSKRYYIQANTSKHCTRDYIRSVTKPYRYHCRIKFQSWKLYRNSDDVIWYFIFGETKNIDDKGTLLRGTLHQSLRPVTIRVYNLSFLGNAYNGSTSLYTIAWGARKFWMDKQTYMPTWHMFCGLLGFCIKPTSKRWV